jgi:two-component system sensor histidine kinase UhpB
MAQTAGVEDLPPRAEGTGRRFADRRRRSSLYVRVLGLNAAILLVGLVLLVWTPVTVSASISLRQVIVLAAAVVVLVIADAALLKLSFTGLAALVHRMQTLDLLRPRERLPELGGAETRALISGFNAMLDRLDAERRESTSRSLTMVEDERRRISRELHDEIGQRLTGVVLRLGLIHDEAEETARARIAATQEEVRAVMDEVGSLAWRIRPAILDDLGLLSALEALATSLSGDGQGRIEAALPARLPTMGSETELAIYRIAQEALTNAVRHAEATVISIRLQVTDAGLVLRVSDDGRGLPDTGSEGPGQRGMRERALLIGGRLRMACDSPTGLDVELVVPVDHRAG